MKTGEARAIQPNPILNPLAQALRKGTDIGNVVQVPVLGGVGDMVFGDAADAAEKMTYGFPVHQGSGQTTQLDPGVADLALLASGPAGATLRALRKGARALNAPKKDVAPDPSRRRFLKQAGTAAAAGAVAATVPKTIREALEAAVEAAPEAITKTATKSAPKLATAARKITDNVLRQQLEGIPWYKPEMLGKVKEFVSTKGLKGAEEHTKRLMDKYGDDFDVDGYVMRTDYSGNSPLWNLRRESAGWDSTREVMDSPGGREAIERWQATGKWPKGKEEWYASRFDPGSHMEMTVDSMSGSIHGFEDEMLRNIPYNEPPWK